MVCIMAIKIIKGTIYWFMSPTFHRQVKPKEYKSPVVAWNSYLTKDEEGLDIYKLKHVNRIPI